MRKGKLSTDTATLGAKMRDGNFLSSNIHWRLGSEDGETKSGDFLPYVGVKTLAGAKKFLRTIRCERLDLSHPRQ